VETQLGDFGQGWNFPSLTPIGFFDFLIIFTSYNIIIIKKAE
jgi:hypothetical protein